MTIVDRRYSVAEGTAVKAPCRAATTANITLSGLQTIDGVALAADDRVLVKSQTTGADNGIYTASTGTWLRTRDFDGAYDIVSGTRVFVISGTASAQIEFFVSTANPIVVGTTSIAFSSIVSIAVAAAAATSAALGLSFTTGDIKLTLKTAADTGWRLFDDGTIGSASSGATYANVLAQDLFTLMYNNFLDANCAITTSAGAATTRAAQTNAATAWAAHCRIALPKTLGRALAISGSGSGLTTRALGVTAGAETVTLDTTMIPSHSHTNTLSDPGHAHNIQVAGGAGTSVTTAAAGNTSTAGYVISNTTGITITNASTGGGLAHANMQPTVFLNAMVKL